MANGYWQKILRVDLTKGKSWVEPIGEDVLKKFIGGAGLAAYILNKEQAGKVEPYSPDNLLIFATGPFQGPSVPGGAKFSIISISGVTGTYADTAGGADWGPEFKNCGYDAVVIKGKASKPVYLLIKDDSVEIKDASDLWGLDAYQTIDSIHKATGDRRVSVATSPTATLRRAGAALRRLRLL